MAKQTFVPQPVTLRIATEIEFTPADPNNANTFDKAKFSAFFNDNYYDGQKKVEVKRKSWHTFFVNGHDARYLSQWFNKGDQLTVVIKPYIKYQNSTDPKYPDELVSFGPDVYARSDGSNAASYTWLVVDIGERGADGQVTAALKAAGAFAQGNQTAGGASAGPQPFAQDDVPF